MADVILTAEVETDVPEGAPVHVTVKPPHQVAHLGIVYRPNEVVEVPEDVAALWIRDGWVTANGPAS
jgi:hypothetical protein